MRLGGGNKTHISEAQNTKKPKLVLGQPNQAGSELSVNIDKLLVAKEQGKTLTFKEVGMKLGDLDLEATDVLASPCRDGQYYLAKDAGSIYYRLENGKTVARFNCWDVKHTDTYKGLRYVEMKWTKQSQERVITRSNGYIVSLDKIAVGSCTFSWSKVGGTHSKDGTIVVQCYDFLPNSRYPYRSSVKGTFNTSSWEAN